MAGFHAALPAFQNALQALLDSAVTSAKSKVGFPAGGIEWSGQVYVPMEGATMEVVDEDSSLSQRDEEMVTDFRVTVQKSTNDPTVARDAAFVILNQVEDGLASDRTLGGLVLSAKVRTFTTHEGVEETDRFFVIEGKIAATATVSR